ncbi:MAG: hypothetical protein V4717_24405 [Bacteroidota bacterium]
MKKLYLLIVYLSCWLASQAQSVGIGTTTPDSTSILDIVSTNKGVLIPRIGDTANVTAPVEGLIIYNKQTKTPYYYNGKKWLSLVGTAPGSRYSTSTDSITYLVTGNGFTSIELPVIGLTQGITNEGISVIGTVYKPVFEDFKFAKKADINSKTFHLKTMYFIGPITASIEFKLYAEGAAIPYLSYRFKNLVFTGINTSVGEGVQTFIETVSFTFSDFGLKNWVTNNGLNFNIATSVVSAY